MLSGTNPTSFVIHRGEHADAVEAFGFVGPQEDQSILVGAISPKLTGAALQKLGEELVPRNR